MGPLVTCVLGSPLLYAWWRFKKQGNSTSHKWKVLDYLPHSSDLAPSVFHLFGHLKDRLTGKQFGINGDMQPPCRFLPKGVWHQSCPCWMDVLVSLCNKCSNICGDCGKIICTVFFCVTHASVWEWSPSHRRSCFLTFWNTPVKASESVCVACPVSIKACKCVDHPDLHWMSQSSDMHSCFMFKRSHVLISAFRLATLAEILFSFLQVFQANDNTFNLAMSSSFHILCNLFLNHIIVCTMRSELLTTLLSNHNYRTLFLIYN